MRFEKAGVPAILFGSTAFVPLARSIAQTSGLTDLRMVIVDHPLGGISEDDLAQRIDDAYDQIVELLGESGEDTADAAAAPNAATNGSSANGASPNGSTAAPATEAAASTVTTATPADPGVDEALDELRSALASDGAGLRVANADDDEIAVELTFTDETCMDCVIPPPILESIITDALQRNGYTQAVSVNDPRA